MISLDHNHHPTPLSPNPKDNLILPTSNTDQHSILTWSGFATDQPHQHFLSESATTVQPDIAAKPADGAVSQPGPITPVDADDPAVAPSSPASPVDAADRSSSLTPPPDSASPQHLLDAEEEPKSVGPPDKAEPVKEEEEEEEELVKEEEATKEEEEEQVQAEKSSRQSTPLSELSTAPDPTDTAPADGTNPEPPETDITAISVVPEEPPVDVMTAVEPEMPTSPIQTAETEQMVTEEVPGPSTDMNIPVQPLASASSPLQSSSTIHPPVVSEVTLPDGESLDSLVTSESPTIANSDATNVQSTSVNTSPTATPLPPSKVVTILELNAELLKVSIDFQMQGIPMSDPRFQQYAQRLQANLTWIAAAADQRGQTMPLPIMEPPRAKSVDLASTDRIQQLYVQLPKVFANDIARRLQMGMPAGGPLPQTHRNLNLKRDRPDDNSGDTTSKRRDTGESKTASMMPPATPSIPRSSPPQSSATTSSTPAPGGGAGIMNHPLSVASPALAASSVPPGLVSATTEAQAAASARERARQIQIRQAIQAQQQQQIQQQQQQQHQPQQGGGRQMSPPSGAHSRQQQQQQLPGQGMQSNVTAGPSMPNANVSASALASLGPNIGQNPQSLQNPNHPFITYMNQTVPDFAQMPLQMQMQKVQMVQSQLQARQQQQQNSQTPTPQRGGGGQQLLGLPTHNVGLPGTQLPNPLANPAMSQSPASHQQSHGQSPQSGMFPFGNGQSGSSTDPRTAPTNMMNQVLQPGMNLSSLTPHQRQLVLIQQQQQQNMIRNNTGNPNVGGMTNPQQTQAQQEYFAAQERMRHEHQQRMGVTQASSPPHAGSPMSASDGNALPTLRSNSTMPGIARSTRSPSETASSPMITRTPSRAPSMTHEDYQRMMHAQQQGQGSQIQGNSNWQQNGQVQHQQTMQMGQSQASMYAMASHGNSSHSGSFGGVPSPSNNQNWSQGAGMGQYSFSSSNHPQQQSDHSQTPRQTSASSTPLPQQHQQMQPQNIGLIPDQPGFDDFFTWT